jgi:hypothetical protein
MMGQPTQPRRNRRAGVFGTLQRLCPNIVKHPQIEGKQVERDALL